MSLLKLSNLCPAEQRQTCGRLVPQRLWDHLELIDPQNLAGGATNPQAFRLATSPHTPEIGWRIPARPFQGDYALSMDLTEAHAGQLELSFIVINDLTSPRFHIDFDSRGQPTLLGTAGRNLEQEILALQAGLGPCQVRRGLRLFRQILPELERLALELGYRTIVLEPLTYHNAVMYERLGFGYLIGHQRMIQINQQFGPAGYLHRCLDHRSPFRAPELAYTPRGRSWAIHDGILREWDGENRLPLRMFKTLGQHANQCTFNLHP